MGRQKKFLRNLRQLLIITWNEDKLLFIGYFTSAFIGAILLFIVYFVYKLMIDQVTQNVSLTASSTLFIIVISYLFFEYLSRFVNFTFNLYYFDSFIRSKLQNALTRQFIGKLGKMDFAHLENGDVRNLIAKVEGTYATRLPEVLHTINALVYNFASLAFSLFIALRFNPIYFIILALFTAPVYYLRAKYSGLAFNAYSSNAPGTNYLWYIRSIFTNFPTLSEMKIYGLRDYFLRKTRSLQIKILSDYQKPLTAYTLLSTASFILVPIAIYFALTNFINEVNQGKYTIGDFTFFLNVLFTFSGQISSILINLGLMYESSFFVNEYFDLLGIKNTITVPEKAYIFKKIEPREIKFENVSFAYPGSKNESLSKINLTIEKGQNTAIVGHNGAGKSTLIKLLFRFYDPSEGRILIDGVDLRTIEVDNWYRHLGVLFQDFARYFLTLKENILFGDLDKRTSPKEIEEALLNAQAQRLLKVLPKGFKQILGRWFEGGIELSGGQWQKIAIARAIFRNAPVLIMDEPTATIDADSEYKIFQHLKKIYRDKNLIFISHRFSTVRTAKKIIVLEKGRVVEEGSHEKLIKNKGLYARFFNLQKRGYE